MAVAGGGAPINSGYGLAPKIRFEVISEAGQLFMQQIATWIMAALVMLVAMAIPMVIVVVAMIGAGIMGAVGGRGGSLVGGLGMMVVRLLAMFVMTVFGSVVMGGMCRMAIKQVRGESIQLSDLWSVTDVIVQLVIAGVLIGLATGIGSMFCLLPGIALGGLLMLTIPLIVDQRMSAMDAVMRSFNTLKQDWMMAFLLYLVFGVILMIGGMFVIGTFFTVPVLALSVALVYRDFILGGVATPTVAPIYSTGVTPGANPPDLYAPQQPPTEPR